MINLDWLKKYLKRKFSVEEVKELLEQIKQFNAGCIDGKLDKHIDNAFEKWLKQK